MPTDYIKAREKIGIDTSKAILYQLEKLCQKTNKAHSVDRKMRIIKEIHKDILKRIGENIVDGNLYIKI